MRTYIALLLIGIGTSTNLLANNAVPALSCTPREGKVVINLNPGLGRFDKIVISRTRKNYVYEEIAVIEGKRESIQFIDENPTEGMAFYKVDFKDVNGTITHTISKGLYVPFRDGIFVNLHDYNLKDGELILSFLNLEKGRRYPLLITIMDDRGNVVLKKKHKVHCHSCIKSFDLRPGGNYARIEVTNDKGEKIFSKNFI